MAPERRDTEWRPVAAAPCLPATVPRALPDSFFAAAGRMAIPLPQADLPGGKGRSVEP